jgi:pimeloyl-ACP methyl ester carboxylesterase
VIPSLAERFTVVAPDLRGLGDSTKPIGGYDKRTLATDVRELVAQLGFAKIGVMAHDWGGAVAFYLCYDNRELVDRLFILDMIPGLARAGEPIPLEVAIRLHHVFFHGGNSDFAAKLASKDIAGFISYYLTTTEPRDLLARGHCRVRARQLESGVDSRGFSVLRDGPPRGRGEPQERDAEADDSRDRLGRGGAAPRHRSPLESRGRERCWRHGGGVRPFHSGGEAGVRDREGARVLRAACEAVKGFQV